MSNKIVLKKSSVLNKVPLDSDLEPGELGINLIDKKLYSKTTSNTIIQVSSGNLIGLSDVSNVTPTNNQILRYETDKFVANTISPSITINISGSVSGTGTAILNDLSSNTINITTTGGSGISKYVENLISGTGVTISGLNGANSIATIDIGQDVSTTADVSFKSVTVDNVYSYFGGFVNDISATNGIFTNNVNASKVLLTDFIESPRGIFSGNVNAGNVIASGNISASNGIFTNNVNASQALFTGNIKASYATITNDINATRFLGTSVQVSNDVIATNGFFSTGNVDSINANLTGNVNALRGNFTNNVNANQALLTGNIQANTGIFVNIISTTGTFTDNISASNGIFTNNVNANQALLTGNINASSGIFTANVNSVNGLFTNNVNISGNVNATDARLTSNINAVNGIFTANVDSNNIRVTNNANVVGRITASSFVGIGQGYSNSTLLTAGTSWAIPNGVYRWRTTLVAPGGQGGGTTANNTRNGNGGGSGAVNIKNWTRVNGQNTMTYNLGTAGSAAGRNAAGQNATQANCTYNAVTVVANGGNGGQTSGTVDGGGTGGTSTGGDINLSGFTGFTGGTPSASNLCLGTGANSPLGWGEGGTLPGTTTGANGLRGEGYGSGGSGGKSGSSNTDRAGGAGAPGCLLIEW